MAKAKHAVPEGHHTVTPQLTLDNAAQAIDWYKKALGAEEVARAVGPDGKIMHAELRIGNSLIMVNDTMGGGKGPKGIRRFARVAVGVCGGLRRAVQPRRGGGREGGRRTHGTADGSVLGRPLRNLHRSARVPLDDRDAQGRSHAPGNPAAAG